MTARLRTSLAWTALVLTGAAGGCAPTAGVAFEGRGDGGLANGACPVSGPRAGDVLRVDFEGDPTGFVDEASGERVAVVGDVRSVAGAARCGRAAELRDGYLVVAARDDFRLEAGELELLFRRPASEADLSAGIFSMDAVGVPTPGHLTVFVSGQGRVVVRLQRGGANEASRCSGPLPADVWTHVRVAFGAEGLALFVDGAPADVREAERLRFATGHAFGIPCDGEVEGGTRDGVEPIVLGASAHRSMEGSTDPVEGVFVGGAIDAVRLRGR